MFPLGIIVSFFLQRPFVCDVFMSGIVSFFRAMAVYIGSGEFARTYLSGLIICFSACGRCCLRIALYDVLVRGSRFLFFARCVGSV